MSVFVDRDREMQLIEDSLQILQNKERLLRNPILEFYGVSGIGKTLLLKKIQDLCNMTRFPCIWIDLVRQKASIQNEIISQVQSALARTDVQAGLSAVSAIKALLKQGPVVMLFDAVDEVSSEQLLEIEELLRDLIDDENLFVVLASKTMTEFKNQRSVARKLKWCSLEALDQSSCEAYLDKWEQHHTTAAVRIESDVRELIIAWTRGYPLAMNVMIEALKQQIDPRTEVGRQTILALLQERVIEQEILKGIEGEWKDACFITLRLLSVPRRSNLIIMEELIKHFAPALSLKRQSSLAYFSLPNELYQATHILSWNLERAGFAVEAPVRHLFLLLYKSAEPQEYFAVQDFLATLNYQLAREATGQERARYAREYLYHLAHAPLPGRQGQRISEAIESILKEQPAILQPFFEEFAQDSELKEALGPYLVDVQAAIERREQHMKKDAQEQ
ncbi:MAG TPA: ATP-binding protein [Ktedonobacteraceae bacterium]